MIYYADEDQNREAPLFTKKTKLSRHLRAAGHSIAPVQILHIA